ncbi:MAG: sigma-70 family RNA polymerase sigma factor [Alphaproteobacteria bacterium]|nr:sigma-70 family RNA polymerase sigma factor [Alphaproteobacteria bacterium]
MSGASNPRTDAALEPLIQRIANERDRAAFAAVFRAMAPKVRGYLLRLGADDTTADEVTQEVMLTLWRKADSYNPKLASVSTWVFTIARNRRIDRIRRSRRPDFDPNDPAFHPDPVESVEVTHEAAETGARLRLALKDLPKEQVALLEMAYFQDKSHRTIADETQLPLGTVKSRIRLALGRLRDRLKD